MTSGEFSLEAARALQVPLTDDPGSRARCTVATLVVRALSASLAAATVSMVSPAHAAACSSNSQSEYSNTPGAGCTIAPGTTAARITASGAGPIAANGISILVPYGTAVTAQGGGSEIFGIDPVAGGSTLGELYAGSGGITGLLATGPGSQITASGLRISLPASGVTVALAQNGGWIALNDGSTITMTSGGGSQGLVASGAGSLITADGLTLQGQTGGGDLGVHSTAGAAIDMTNSTVSLTSQGGGVIGVLADGASSFSANDTAISVSGGGNIVGAEAAGGSNVALGGGSVTVNGAAGSSALLAQGAGTTLGTTDTAITTNAVQSAAGTVQNGGTLVVNGGSVQANGNGSVAFLINGAAGIANTVELNGTTASSTAGSFSVQGAVANIGLSGSTVVGNNGSLLATQGGATTMFDAGGSVLSGAVTTDSGSTANLTLHDGTDWTMTGNSNMTSLANSDSIIRFAPPAGDSTQLASYRTLIAGNYAGAAGTVELNTYLGGDGSPSDRLIIDGGTASGTTGLVIHNTTGEGASTRSNGILLVQTTNGATTAPTAFALAGEARAGAFDYGLFRGGVNGSSPDDWFLRSDFVVSGVKPVAPLQPGPPGFEVTEPALPTQPAPPTQPTPPTQPAPPGGTVTPAIPNQPVPPGRVVPEPAEPSPSPGESVAAESPELTVDPPPAALPPGTYPIIGPELATDSVVQPIARQMGLTMLGTLHERIGDTLADPTAGADGWTRSSWGRFFGQQIDNRYRAFVDPRASGQLLGVQAGLDIWRGSLIPGQRDAAGAYFAYANSALNVDGLVTDLDLDSYVQAQTGKVNLDAYSGGLYWTHYGPTGWYVDAVLQGTRYDGSATTETARLPISGYGLVSSLEAGYPIPLPLGPRFVLEPQMQVIWQHVSFSDANDGLGSVDLGSTSGTTGRLGVRGRWSIDGRNGQVWEPYGRINLWHDWGGRATTVFGEDSIPLLEQATRLEFAGGVTTRIDKRFSAYLQAGYQFAVGDTAGGRRQGVQGDVGVRYTW